MFWSALGKCKKITHQGLPQIRICELTTYISVCLSRSSGVGPDPPASLPGSGRGRKVVLQVWRRLCPWLTYKQVQSGAAGHSPPQGHILEVTTSANLLKPVSEQQRAARGVGRGVVLSCQQLPEEGGRDRGEAGGERRCAGAYADRRRCGRVVLEPRSARPTRAHLLGCGAGAGVGPHR